MGAKRIGRAQAGAEVVGVGDAIEHQQQRRPLEPGEQLIEQEGLAQRLGSPDFGDHTLVHRARRPAVQLLAALLAHTHTVARGGIEQFLQASITPPAQHEQRLNALRCPLEQRTYRVQPVNALLFRHGVSSASPAALARR